MSVKHLTYNIYKYFKFEIFIPFLSISMKFEKIVYYLCYKKCKQLTLNRVQNRYPIMSNYIILKKTTIIGTKHWYEFFLYINKERIHYVYLMNFLITYTGIKLNKTVNYDERFLCTTRYIFHIY